MSKLKIEKIESKLFEAVVADEIIASIKDLLDEQDFVTLGLAGGSTPAGIHRCLSRPPRVGEIDWSKLKLFLGDERWVGLDHDHSNYRMIKETLLHDLPQPGPQVFPVNTSAKSIEQGAQEYSATLLKECTLQDGVPILDLLLLGLGEDGHTASLFPNSSALSSENLCLAVPFPYGEGQRVTLSAKVLCAARRVIFIAKGPAKSEVLLGVLSDNGSEQQYPARICHRMNDVTFFLDSQAAHLLAKQ